MRSLISALRQAARRLGQARGFMVAAVLTLALGIGASATVFSVVHAVLLRPLPYPAPDRLVSLSHRLVLAGLVRVVVGLLGALALTRSLAASLFEVDPMDPGVLSLAAVFLLVMAAAASWLPARRAAAIDPALVLRSE
jgi:ABC-type antimicrobial peptide transport system permease subunit